MISMNPNRVESIQFEVPSPPPSGGEVSEAQKQETQPAHQESSPSKQTSAPVIPPVTPALQTVPVPAIATSTDDDDDTTSDAVAAGTDRHPEKIDKQWVDKAKAIVLQTKDDPYTQKNEMSKFKSEYIKSRFNKSTKSG